MSSHYEKQEPLSPELIEKIIKRLEPYHCCCINSFITLISRYVNVGLFYLRQLFFAKFDLKVHTDQGNGLNPSIWIIRDKIISRKHRLHSALVWASRVHFSRQIRQADTWPRLVLAPKNACLEVIRHILFRHLRPHNWRIRCRVLWVTRSPCPANNRFTCQKVHILTRLCVRYVW